VQHTYERFHLFAKDSLILDYAYFLNDLGLWQWEKELIESLKQSFKTSMWEYNE
jgi:hypothetical protein